MLPPKQEKSLTGSALINAIFPLYLAKLIIGEVAPSQLDMVSTVLARWGNVKSRDGYRNPVLNEHRWRCKIIRLETGVLISSAVIDSSETHTHTAKSANSRAERQRWRQ